MKRIALGLFGLLLLAAPGAAARPLGSVPPQASTCLEWRLQPDVPKAGAPKAVVGVLIALIVLLPETGAALRAARGNRMQSSLNLALGSGLASIGLTIPVVAALSPWFPFPLVLGLRPTDIVLLMLTLVVGTLTLGSGRATVMQGAVHLVLFAAFLFLTVVP